MNRKLVLLNVALAGAVTYGGVELRQQWKAAKEREVQIDKSGHVPPVPAPPFRPLQEVPPVMPSGYAKIAQQFLLDPSRNPDVPVPVHETPAPPPPPKMPGLPCYHGMMNFGDGPEIILGENCGAAHKRLHPGQTIGEFTVVAFNSHDIELQWNGEQIIRPLAEISGHGGEGQGGGSAQAEAAQPNVRPAPVAESKGFAADSNAAGEHGCVDGDTDPYGTVKDGLVKTLVRNGLMKSENCIWKPVGR